MLESSVERKKPKRISLEAEASLVALSEAGLGRRISLGGAFAIAYYHEYRETHAIVAWWEEGGAQDDPEAVV